jgi:hypothetical protein
VTEQPTISEVIADFLAAMPAPVRRELHVAEPVSRFLRDTYAKATSPGHAAAMTGLPIVVDDALTGGQWQLLEDGQVTKSGDMAPAPEGMVVVYDRHAGWVAMDKTLASEVGI